MTSGTQYTYEPLVSCTDPSFDEFFGIYMDSIPLREQKSKMQISEIAARPDYKILLLRRNADIIGFSILFIPADELFCLLEYMAIQSACRNLGLGKELFLRTLQDVVSCCGTIPVIIEVDSDREQSADREIRRRRQQFYRNLGCLRIDGLSYILPLHEEGSPPGEENPPQMDLMLYIPDCISFLWKYKLEHWLKVIYNKVYGCSPDDPRIAQMLEAVSDPVKLV